MLSPFHNWRTTTLQHFAIEIFKLRTTCRIRCTITRIRCICFSGRIKSHQNSWHAHYSDAIKIIAMQRKIVRTNVVQRFVCSHEWCTIFKGRKTSRSCLCVCCATMRLLLNMLHVIVQRFTMISQHDLSASIFHAVPLVYIPCTCISISVLTMDAPPPPG